MTLEEYRIDFENSVNRSVSMPIAGAIVWLTIAVVSTQVAERTGILILLFASGLIFPIGLAIARIRKEILVSSPNPLAKLMGYCVFIVNLLWAIHVPLFIYTPEFVPLSIGIGLGLHWVVCSWIVRHPVGITHSILRTILILVVWFLLPDQRVLAIGLVIVFVYSISIFQMLTRPMQHITSHSKPTPQSGSV